MAARVTALFQDVVTAYADLRPVNASGLGLNRNDSRLDDFSPRALDHEVRTIARLREEIGRIRLEAQNPTHALSVDDALDLDLAEALLGVEDFLRERMRLPQIDPTLPLRTAIYGVFWLLLREIPIADPASGGPARRARDAALIGRLRDTPRCLEANRQALLDNVVDVPRVWTDIALDLCKSGILFLRESLPPLINGSADEIGAMAAIEQALGALSQYEVFLREQIAPRAGGRTAIGEEGYNTLLHLRHFLPADADEVERAGLTAIAHTKDEMRAVAGELLPDATLEVAVQHMLSDHLEHPAELVPAYAMSVRRAREFLQQTGIVTLPSPDRLDVTLTPTFARPTTPYAAYQQPPAFGSSVLGHFWLTPPDPGGSPEDLRAAMRIHTRAGIDLVTVHEAYPGHHLQYLRTNAVERPIRKLFKSSVFVEGWGLYCEQLMHEQGFYRTGWTRLFQLSTRLLRACRAVIDPRLACGAMSVEEAIDLLVSQTALHPRKAAAEVRRYSMYPTQPMSYLIGYQQLLAMLDRRRMAEGSAFSLPAFHDAITSYGTIPLSFIERLMAA